MDPHVILVLDIQDHCYPSDLIWKYFVKIWRFKSDNSIW